MDSAIHQKNYFNTNKEFFFIDSNNLDSVKTRFYGYSIQDTGIYEEGNLDEQAVAGLDGCGCYIYVKADESKITIQQDFNGSYGIYLYSTEGYFALSNSFYMLIEHLKEDYTLTLNIDYCNHILCDTLASLSCQETPICEIKLIDKDLNIIISNNTVKFQQIDYKENSIKLSSEEGIQVLDQWFYRWTALFRNLKMHTNNISVDLSGGFDSRIVFMLMAESGINLNEIRVNAVNDDLHTHREDYEIASELAKHYNVELNKKLDNNRLLYYSFEDIVNMAYHNKMGFHKEIYFRNAKKEDKVYRVGGGGGEGVRDHWDYSESEFIDRNINYANPYPKIIQRKMKSSIEHIIKDGISIIKEKYSITDDHPKRLGLAMYRAIRCRSHFGKSSAGFYFSNDIVINPLIDPIIRSLRLTDDNCLDKNLLFALIYTRYCPYLLSVRYEGGRQIERSTMEYAEKINARFKVYSEQQKLRTEKFDIVTRDLNVTRILDQGSNNKEITIDEINKYFAEVFESRFTKSLFTMYFDEEIYRYARKYALNKKYFPLRHCMAILSITEVIRLIINSGSHTSFKNNMDNAINLYEKCENKENLLNHEILKRYITARVDIKSTLKEDNDIQFDDIDDMISINSPKWFCNNGKGYVLHSQEGSIDISFKCIGDGNLIIYLRAMDVRDENNNRLPIFINYRSFELNGQEMLSGSKECSHDKPYKYECRVKDGDSIQVHIEWEPSKHMCLEEKRCFHDL